MLVYRDQVLNLDGEVVVQGVTLVHLDLRVLLIQFGQVLERLRDRPRRNELLLVKLVLFKPTEQFNQLIHGSGHHTLAFVCFYLNFIIDSKGLRELQIDEEKVGVVWIVGEAHAPF